jgi:predicted dehydrogenase
MPDARRLRWALLGTARINRLVIPAIRASSRSTLVAVASRDRARAEAYAAEWTITRAIGSYDELLDAADIDIVYIPLPNSLHADWCIRAVERGKHVLCEKPLALSVPDVDRIAAAASRQDRTVTEGFMYRHHAQTARVCELVESGAIGTLRVILSGFTYPQSRAADVRLEPRLGGGCLWDVGCYPVSFAQHVAGAPPARVSGWKQMGPTGVDEAFAGTLTYANGVVCQVHAGFRAAYQTVLRLIGTDGVLEVERPFRPGPLETLRLQRGASVEPIVVEGSPGFVDEVIDMEDATLGIRPARITLAESRLHVATIEALHRAATERRDVEM